jgi:serine/threonine-protein kinase
VEEIAAGTQVTPSIRLKRRIGAGGMGSVWIADHAALQTEVVVKLLADRLADDPTSQARFSREAAAAAHVKSPHVVQMLDHGVMEDGQPFIVMELLEGRDLGKLIRERRLTPAETAHVIEHVALALGQAHAKGIVHRDIKPTNIFLCDVGADLPFVKLLDFGIALAGDQQLTATGNVVGTPSFMSPEQLSGQDVGPASDLWSLGMVAFKALTGANPFERPSAAETMGAVLHGKLPIPTRYVPELPASTDVWFARACARDPALRFASAREMAESLWAALGFERAIASSPSANLGALSSAELTRPVSFEPITEGTLRSTVGSSSGRVVGPELAPARPRRPIAWLLGAAAAAGVLAAGAVAIHSAASDPVSVLTAAAPAVSKRIQAIEIAEQRPPLPPPPAAAEPTKPARRAPIAVPRPAPKVSEDEDNLGF